MRQTLHIFRKDVRFLWPNIITVLALNAAFCWGHVDPPWLVSGVGGADSTLIAITFFLVLSWWFLIASAIYKEPSAGTDQFWVTRPYSWKSLLAAKALLIVGFISIPLLVSDMVILFAHGFAPSSASLLARQIEFAGILILPVAALATVTRHLAQMALTILAVALSFVFMQASGHVGRMWGPTELYLDWIIVAILFVGGLAASVWQFAQRRRLVACGVLLAGAGLWLALPRFNLTSASIAIASHWPEPGDVRAVRLCCADVDRNAQWFPIRIGGVPAGMTAEPNLLEVNIYAPKGAAWNSGWISSDVTADPNRVAWLRFVSDVAAGDSLAMTIGRQLTDRFRPSAATVRVSVAMTIYRIGPTVSLTLDGRPHSIPGIGTCSLGSPDGNPPMTLACRAPEYPSASMQMNGLAISGEQFASQAMFDPNPFFEYTGPPMIPNPPTVVTTKQPIAHIRRDLELVVSKP